MNTQSRDLQIIEKILKYCCEIDHAHSEFGCSYDIFSSNPTYRNAIAMCLMQIGELTVKLSDEFKNSYTEIPWRAIKGMRNMVAHEYANIDIDVVWATSISSISQLRDFCQRII